MDDRDRWIDIQIDIWMIEHKKNIGRLIDQQVLDVDRYR